jgi:hypothetical protein
MFTNSVFPSRRLRQPGDLATDRAHEKALERVGGRRLADERVDDQRASRCPRVAEGDLPAVADLARHAGEHHAVADVRVP